MVAQGASEQVKTEAPKPSYKLGVHLGLAGAGISTLVSSGRKTNVGFNAIPSFGASLLLPFQIGSDFGLRFDVGHTTTTNAIRPYKNYRIDKNQVANPRLNEEGFENSLRETHSFTTIGFMANVSGFLVGLGYNINTGYWHEQDSLINAQFGESFESGKGTTSGWSGGSGLDVRLGASLPVWRAPIGTLYVDVMGRYFLSSPVESYRFGQPVQFDGGEPLDNAPISEKKTEEFVPASIQIGVAFLFDIRFF